MNGHKIPCFDSDSSASIKRDNLYRRHFSFTKIHTKGKKNNNCRFYFVTQAFKSYFTLIYHMFTFQYLHFEIILHRKILESY